ncbi:MAG: carbonic anhydrase [Saccharolobus sp.]
MRLVISCMDRRLNNYLKKNYEHSIIIRNAGANINSLQKTLEKYKDIADEVVVLPHTDCGAMKVVYSSLVEGKKLTELVENKLSSQFVGKQFSSLSDLERLNLSIQKENAMKIFGNKVRAELIDINKIDIPPTNQPYMVYLTNPSKPIELESNIYVISADEDDIWDSLDIAFYGMRINKVKVNYNNSVVVDKIKSTYPFVTLLT